MLARLLILYFSSNQSIYDQQSSQFKMLDNWQIGLQIDFLIDIIFALAAGFVIGEKENQGVNLLE
jgi:ribose/xylose/arabinose/galactoside ABC-type transport system permease subunit